MADDTTPQNSIVDSDHSRLSEVALIEKFFTEVRNFDAQNRDRKYSRKYNVTENHIEEGSNSMKWIPSGRHEYGAQSKAKKCKTRSEKKLSSKYEEPMMATLESDKTSSSCTASDFTGNVYSKNGYIRGTHDKKIDRDFNSLLKYNEFSSLISTLGAGAPLPVEVKLDEKDVGKSDEKRHWLDEESSIYIILGGIQMMLGILMAVFGVLVIAHDSSLSGAGSGLWGGATAMFAGLIGILAGLRGCYTAEKGLAKTSRSLLTCFLALCLVSFALSNLVVVLTATGLIRDVQRSKDQNESGGRRGINWPPILADSGLILASALQCVAAVFSGYKCYKKVCPCLKNNKKQLSEADSQKEKFKNESKERFVSNWLGQQFRIPEKKGKFEGQDGLMPWGTPNLVLLPPPPPMITNGQIPILTFLQSPSSVFGSSGCGQMYPNSMPCCCRHDTRYIPNPQPMVHERRSSRRANYLQPDIKVRHKHRNRSTAKQERRASLPTTEEVARTYTGLDREIAEEFIAIAMDKSPKRSRTNSFAEYGIDSSRPAY
ncbi:hypothetical protein RUM43_004750 [Polyplax serrata]|uniref:Uncharacterized protein n=1 Tax=Polyplax serrata TaxID=468196 RepID=A0AAN8SB71_POLSC